MSNPTASDEKHGHWDSAVASYFAIGTFRDDVIDMLTDSHIDAGARFRVVELLGEMDLRSTDVFVLVDLILYPIFRADHEVEVAELLQRLPEWREHVEWPLEPNLSEASLRNQAAGDTREPSRIGGRTSDQETRDEDDAHWDSVLANYFTMGSYCTFIAHVLLDSTIDTTARFRVVEYLAEMELAPGDVSRVVDLALYPMLRAGLENEVVDLVSSRPHWQEQLDWKLRESG